MEIGLFLSNHKSVIIGSIDFQKALDTVSHSKLLHKLIGFGIQWNLLLWISSFLSNRTQRVRIGTSFSDRYLPGSQRHSARQCRDTVCSSRSTRGHSIKLTVPIVKCNRSNFFFVQVCSSLESGMLYMQKLSLRLY